MLLQLFTFFIAIYFLSRNKIDFLLLFFLSSLLYNWQVIYGIIWVPPYTFLASPESQIIVSIILAVTLFFTLLNDVILRGVKENSYDQSKERDDLKFYLVLTCLSYLTTLYAISKGFSSILGEKREFLFASGLTFYFITYYPAAMSFLFFLISKRYKYAVFASLPLIFYTFIGYRAAAVITIIISFFIFYYNKKIFNLNLYKPFLLLVTIISFFVLYKFSYIGLKIGDLSAIATIIDKDTRFDSYLEFLSYAFFSAEFGQTASNLSMTSSMDLSKEYSFSSALLGSIPLVESLTNISEEASRFSTIIEAYANPGFSYGLGSSIWGEIYQAGNYAGVFVFCLLIVFIIFQYNLAFMRSKERFSIFAYYIGFMAFYIHRNDFVLVVAHIKNIVFIAIIAFIILWMTRNKIIMNPFIK